MISIARTVFALLLGTTFCAAPALAQPDASPTYQGRLLMNGQPANGLYRIVIEYYNSEIGGTLVDYQLMTDVPVTDGLFTVPLDDFNANADTHTELWLEFRVVPMGSTNPLTTLTPRQRITNAPYATRAATADFSLTSGTGLTDAYLNDPTILGTAGTPVSILGTDLIAGNSVLVGQPSVSTGQLNLYGNFSPNPIAGIGNDGTSGGYMRVHQTLNGVFAVDMQVDSNGGGYFTVAKNTAGTGGFIVDGNYEGSNAPRVILRDASGLIHTVIVASVPSGTSSVQFPEGAIDDLEIFNEPGVTAARRNAANTALLTIATSVLSRAITPPAAGFLVISGVAEISVVHTTGTNSTATAGIGINGVNGYLNGIEHGHRIPSSAPSGTYIVAVPVHDVYQVSSTSTRTVSLLCEIDGGTGTIVDSALSAVYVPTAYGTTSGSVLHDPTRPENAPSLHVLRPEVHAAEREAEQQWSQQDMIDRMRQLEARIQAQEIELHGLRTEDD